MKPTLHATLTPLRWGRFPVPQRILMIANELNRAVNATDDIPLRRSCLARSIELLFLTVETVSSRGLRKELLRLHELLAAVYIGKEGAETLRACRSVIMTLDPVAYRSQ